MRAFIISCLFCVLIWFLILAIVGFMTWLKDRKRRKRNEHRADMRGGAE